MNKIKKCICRICNKEIILGCGDFNIVSPACGSCGSKDDFYHYRCLVLRETSKLEESNLKLQAQVNILEKLLRERIRE